MQTILMRDRNHMLTSKLKVYHADYYYYTYYDYYTIPIGITQLNAFSCANKEIFQ